MFNIPKKIATKQKSVVKYVFNIPSNIATKQKSVVKFSIQAIVGTKCRQNCANKVRTIISHLN